MSKTFVIVGAIKSGTSAVVGVVNILGVKGWGNYKFLDDIEFYDRYFMGEIDALIQGRNQQYDEWVVKIPQLPNLVDIAIEKLTNPHFIYIGRNPVDVVMHTWNRKNREVNNEFQKRVVDVTKIQSDIQKKIKNSPNLSLTYESLIANPETGVGKIADFISKPVLQSAIDFIDASKGYQDVGRFL